MPARLLDVRLRGSRRDAREFDLPDDTTGVRLAAGRIGRDLTGTTRLDARGVTGERLAALVEGLVLGSYRFTLATDRPDETPLRVDLCGADRGGQRAVLDRAMQAAAAASWARDLANTRSNVKTPAWLGEQARAELRPLGVTVQVRDERWLLEQGFGGVLAVGRGSANPPRLIEASWRPRGARKGHLVLVGKGITFDTGGINLKRGDAAKTMFTDMAGGAAVLGALRLIASLDLPVRVTALVPAAENSIGASSFRASDVVRHYGGRTSEIGNTDAEGRLVLADAMAYAVDRLRPSALVDIATLTGAMKVALGVRTGGLLANTDRMADALLAAGEVTGEPLWRLPLDAGYESMLSSDVADATNAPGGPGGITAALFLQHFVGRVPWAHLDVAGPARAAEDDGMLGVGATGFGARLLAAWAAGPAAW